MLIFCFFIEAIFCSFEELNCWLMIVFLIGYMGCGKSTVGEILANKIQYEFMDFDKYLEDSIGMSITETFKQKGEIFFRKQEYLHLDKLLELDDYVISLGGGTPCYGDNITRLTNSNNAKVIYLKASVDTLTNRLYPERSKRPLISHLDSQEALNDYIRKHLFERNYYYNQAQATINIDNLTPQQVADNIQEILS
jgi:shikimate kinase